MLKNETFLSVNPLTVHGLNINTLPLWARNAALFKDPSPSKPAHIL